MTAVFALFSGAPVLAVRVAMVKGFVPVGGGALPMVGELNEHWDRYGDTRVIIDTSLLGADSFDLDDLIATGADVLWISNPAGGLREYTPDEIAAIVQYAQSGHHVFGTFRVFRFDTFDNRDLAPVFGLPAVSYNIGPLSVDPAFDLLDAGHPLFAGLSDPFVSMGLHRAQAPNDDGTWEAMDFGNAEPLAITEDRRGVITLYRTEHYHAVYSSVFVEFAADPVNAADTQFVYNVLTLDAAPTGSCCLGDGVCDVLEEAECPEGAWTRGGVCDPNPCPQLGACCDEATCTIVFEADCPTGTWTEGLDCVSDTDGDTIIDACDVCPGFDDFADDDGDGVPDGCDRCPGFDDAFDADGDGVPDDCDACPGFDDALDADGDGVPDACDICPGFDDASDCDEDGTPDGCDDEPDCNENGLPDHCEIRGGAADCDENGVPDDCQPDGDGDGLIDPCDACDGNNALIGRTCDSMIDPDDCATGVYDCETGALLCSDDPAADDVDSDGDGVFDCNDECPGTPPGVIVLPDGCRPGGACCFAVPVCFDMVPPEDCTLIGGVLLGIGLSCDGDPDGDGVAGCADGCPLDPNKAAPGQCGCGQSDADSDEDGAADCVDQCPEDPGKTEPGLCGCGVDDGDRDGDGAIDCQDGCPDDPDKTEPGVCGCGVAEVDTDADGVLDCEDGCPTDPNKQAPGVCGCGVADVDTDDDGALDCQDECPTDPDKTEPGVCGCGVIEDTSDADGDGVVACFDACPDTEPEAVVDEVGCALAGACCFRAGNGVCLDGTVFSACIAVGGRYQGNGSSCAEGCLYDRNADSNDNGRIDLDDAAHFTDCMTGPDVLILLGVDACDLFDVDTSQTVDLADFAAIQNAFGP